MAQLEVRNLEEGVKARLRRRANRHGRSMEEEVRDILRNAVRAEGRAALALGSCLRRRFARIGLVEDIPELHRQKARPMVFEK
jgi:plasmid stability protein